MSKPLAFSIAACLAFSGCQIFHKSPTWDKVVHTRIALPREGDNSMTFAEGLHHELKADRVEHKIVTYQYRFRSRLREDATAERTAVIYRDDSNPTYPWWLKDESSGRPVWLPNGSVEQQIRFYVGRDVQIQDPGHLSGDGKRIAAVERESHARRIVHAPRLALPPVAEAPREIDPNVFFREAHGTDFNSASRADREKMNALLRARNTASY